MMRPLLSALMPAGARARLSIFIFHRVLPRKDPLFPEEMDAAQFEAVCSWFRKWFNVLALPEAHARLRTGSLPARAVAITFDDGYADNHAVALPILGRHGLSATFFVATGFVDGGVMWNDRVIAAIRDTRHRELDLGACGVPGLQRPSLITIEQRRGAIDAVLPAIKHLPAQHRLEIADCIVRASGVRMPTELMMTSEQIRALHRAGHVLGAHTISHPILRTLDDSAARIEIEGSRTFLEQMLQCRIGLFAYPNGRPDQDYGAATVRLVKAAGFDASVTTARGAATGATDSFQIPRFTPWDRVRWRFGLRVGANLFARPQMAGQ